MFPKVSILVPVYGVEERIERCARSLFEQTYENLEYVFVDDCTPDNSILVLNSTIEQYPNRLSLVKIISHKHNLGLASARNTALDNATGEFVIHVDSDDYLSANAIEELVKQQNIDDSDIVNSGYKVYHKSHVEEWYTLDSCSSNAFTACLLSRKIPVCVAGRLIRKSLYVDNMIRALDGVNMAEDYAVSPLLAYHAKKISTLNVCLYHYDCTNDLSYTHSFSEEKCNQMWRVLDYLCIFFNEKGIEYKDALVHAELSILIMQLKLCAIDGHQSRYYQELLNRLSNIDDKSYYKKILIYDRPVLSINNYRILKWYVNIAFFLKRILKRIRSINKL